MYVRRVCGRELQRVILLPRLFSDGLCTCAGLPFEEVAITRGLLLTEPDTQPAAVAACIHCTGDGNDNVSASDDVADRSGKAASPTGSLGAPTRDEATHTEAGHVDTAADQRVASHHVDHDSSSDELEGETVLVTKPNTVPWPAPSSAKTTPTTRREWLKQRLADEHAQRGAYKDAVASPDWKLLLPTLPTIVPLQFTYHPDTLAKHEVPHLTAPCVTCAPTC